MSIETTNLLMESAIVLIDVVHIAAVALAAFGFCLLAIAIAREARGPHPALFPEGTDMQRPLGPQTADPHRIPASIVACIAALISVAVLPSTARAQNGDLNCDGAVNIADVPLFVQALLNPGGFGGCDINRADMNADALINGRDAQAFVAALLLSPCPVDTIPCGAFCVYWESDLGNCGSCGHACAGGEQCYGGECHAADPCGPDCGGGGG